MYVGVPRILPSTGEVLFAGDVTDELCDTEIENFDDFARHDLDAGRYSRV